MNVLKFRKERKLGVAQGKRVYDLPLNTGEGAGFLVLLIGLMTFLAAFALAGSMTLGSLSARWTSGLENKLTIEIPTEDIDGKTLSSAQVTEMTEEISRMLNEHQAVQNANMLDKEEVAQLLSPWLGEDLAMDALPLPGLISVEMEDSRPEILSEIERKIKIIAPAARIDRHESWLNDLLRFAGALRFTALAIVLIIGATTVTAIAGAIRARMAVHAEEVELLHLMGAKDDYITKQFKRHALILALMGGAAGSAAGGFALLLIGLISGEAENGLLPDFSLSLPHMLMLLLLPAVAGGIAVATAHVTVLRVLARMP